MNKWHENEIVKIAERVGVIVILFFMDLVHGNMQRSGDTLGLSITLAVAMTYIAVRVSKHSLKTVAGTAVFVSLFISGGILLGGMDRMTDLAGGISVQVALYFLNALVSVSTLMIYPMAVVCVALADLIFEYGNID